MFEKKEKRISDLEKIKQSVAKNRFLTAKEISFDTNIPQGTLTRLIRQAVDLKMIKFKKLNISHKNSTNIFFVEEWSDLSDLIINKYIQS